MIKTSTCPVYFAAFLVLVISVAAMADTTWYDAEGFEEPLFTQGNLAGYDLWSGQDGWLITSDGFDEPNLDGIVVQNSFVFEGEQAIMYDASVQDYYCAWLRVNTLFEPLIDEPVVDVILDIYIEDSQSRSEVWGIMVQSNQYHGEVAWLIWDDNRLTMLDPDLEEYVNTGFEFERNTWYNTRTSMNYSTLMIDLYIDDEYVYSMRFIDGLPYFAFASIYNGVPGDDRLYFDNYKVISHSSTGIGPVDCQVSDNFSLTQNYPNPFNAATTIQYNLPEASTVTIDIYDINGRKVTGLFNGIQPAGSHQVIWDANDVSTGMYFYKLQANDYTETKKMVLLK